MNVELQPFEDSMLPEAGALLAARHRHDRQEETWLPERFEDPSRARQSVAVALGREHARGLAAFSGRRLVGYMIGEMVLDPVWGRSGWVRLPGWALAEGQSVELLRDL